MFAMDSQLKAMKDKIQNIQAGDRSKEERIRGMEAKHRSELESHSRSSRMSSKQQVRRDRWDEVTGVRCVVRVYYCVCVCLCVCGCVCVLCVCMCVYACVRARMLTYNAALSIS